MKQHITPTQLTEISEDNREVLRKWWKPLHGELYTYAPFRKDDWDHCWEDGEYHFFDFDKKVRDYEEKNPDKAYPLLSIGQMIEFLDDDTLKIMHSNMDELDSKIHEIWWHVKLRGRNYFAKELCDALWEAVKYLLPEKKDD